MSVESSHMDPVVALEAGLTRYPGLLVAFSAGVDSGFLLAAAIRTLGRDRVLAVTAVSASLPAAELAAARELATALGARHREVATDEMARDGYRRNATSRCYFCKSELLDVVVAHLAELPPGSVVATGTNADDLVAGFRPGIRAAAERGAVTPLADAGLTKAQIRSAARAWGLPIWDKPQAACLSSRVAYGIEISPSRLARVEAAEIAVRSALAVQGLSSRDVRVRDLGEEARIEIDAHLAADAGPWRGDVISRVQDTGFTAAWIDPVGFRSGSMNEGLTATP